MASWFWWRRCEACGADTEHGNKLCEACAYWYAGKPGDCPNCGGATERAGAPCASCTALVETDTTFLM